MNPCVRAGLVAGAIGGEAMILVVLVNTILLRNFSDGTYGNANPGLVAFWGVAFPLIVILVFEGGGIFASWLCRSDLKGHSDALVTGTIAGITIGIILEIMWMANILSLASRSLRLGSSFTLGNNDPFFIAFLLIILVAMGSVLSAFGSYIFAACRFRREGNGAVF